MLLLESVINRYLALDPEAQESMSQLKGRVIRIDITGIDRSVYMLPDEQGLRVRLQYDAEPDTVIRGGLLALFRMGLASDVTSFLLGGEVEITGDTSVGYRFRNVFNDMDIDWSEPLAQIIGDAAASQLVDSSKALLRWGQDSVDSVSRSVGEYLQEESRDVVGEAELEIFCRDVDELRDDVDRLEARLRARLEAYMNKQGQEPAA